MDNDFNNGVSDAPSNVYTSTVQSDGKILIGGNFLLTNNVQKSFLVRLNSDGVIDTSFNAGGLGANSSVYDIVVLADGKFLIGGSFTIYNGQFPRARIARLNADGSIVSSFNPGSGANGTVLDIAPQSDGRILIGGAFTTYNEISRNRLARLNADGSLDTTFNVGTGADGTVYTLAPQPSGKILIGGFFANYNGKTSNRLARIKKQKGCNYSPSAFSIFLISKLPRPIRGRLQAREIFVRPYLW